ncbi:MAG: hypothetical protein IKS55_04525 [Oscillospiraceae bacterium]|nr:hypothetical protein [Oscillospiraceae bacterium]
MKQNILLRVLCTEADRVSLQPILGALKEKGLRVSDAEGSLKKGELLLAVLSEQFFADEQKQKTLLEALGAGAENVLPLKLDESEVPDALMNALYARNIITATGRSPDLIAERVLSAIPEKKNNLPKLLIAGAAVLVVLAGLFLWRSAGTKTEPAVTPEPISEEEPIAVPVSLGLTEADLSDITQVVIAGEYFGYATDAMRADGEGADRVYAVREDDGEHWYGKEDGREYSLTRYDDLRFLALMPKLRDLEIALIEIDPESLPELNALLKNGTVRLSNCSIDSLSWLSGAEMEEFSVSGCAVTDYSPLTSCARLREAEIDLTGQTDADFSGFAPPALQELITNNGESLRNPDLSALSGSKNLTSLYIDHLPLTELSFLQDLPSLEFLVLDTCSALRDISGVGTLKNLKNLEILYCERVPDYSPIAGCTALEKIHVQGDRNPDALRDASFLADLPKLRDIGLYSCNLVNMDFLEGIARNQDSIRLGFAGDIRDYSGLAHIRHYEYLHVNPRNSNNPLVDSRGGDFSAVLPYIQDAQIDELMLYTCRGVDLSALPDGIQNLSIRYGDLEDLGGLKPYSLWRLELWDCQYLSSLNGMENIPTLFGDGGQVELEIVGCPRLNDWSALAGTYLGNLKLVGTYSVPDLSNIKTNTLRLESTNDLSNLHCLDTLDSSWRYILELVGLDDLYDLTPLRRLHGDKLTVPPQDAEQAEELVEAGNFKEYDVAYPDSGWQPYEGTVELLSLDDLETLPRSMLKKVEHLCIVGDRIDDGLSGWVREDRTTGEPIPCWFNPETEELTALEQGSITDLSIFSELTGLRELALYCQPLENLDGIQNLSSLERLQVNYCPNLTDASAAFALQDLRELDLRSCPVESIQGVQNLNRMQRLCLSDTQVSDLSPLQDCDFREAYENGGLSLEISELPAEDLSALSSIRQLRNFCPNNLDAALWVPALENTELFELSAVGCFHDNESFAALVAAHPELERLDIPWNDGLTDLTPVLSLEHLQYLKVSENMATALEPVQAANPAFEIEIQS